MKSSQRKHYHDRERYLQMTQKKREAYLERNCKYKRMRRDDTASSSYTQAATWQPDTARSTQMETLTSYKENVTNVQVPDPAPSSKEKQVGNDEEVNTPLTEPECVASIINPPEHHAQPITEKFSSRSIQMEAHSPFKGVAKVSMVNLTAPLKRKKVAADGDLSSSN